MSQNEALKVGREKYWDEKSDQEKIESLANTVRFMADRCYRMQCRIDSLEGHAHDSLGRVMTPLDRNTEYGYPNNWAYGLRGRDGCRERG